MPRKQASGATKAGATKTARKKRATKVPQQSVGLSAAECQLEGLPPELSTLADQVDAIGGRVLTSYHEPWAGGLVLLAALPIERVAPTPFQRELSKTHAERLRDVIPKVGRFLDPIVVVANGSAQGSADRAGADDGAGPAFITPNGMHRLSAMRALGAKAIIALVVPEHEVAYRILALNTEKAHNLRDKALEVVRMAEALQADESGARRKETELALEFEQPAYLTLGLCYEQNGRFSGGAYMPVLTRCEEFQDAPLRETMPARKQRAERLLELDHEVNEAVKKLKEAGFTSGYLKPVVVARINPLRFVKKTPGEPTRADFDKTITRMLEGARKFDASKVKASDIALAASMGAGEEN
jgi:ParB family chromosome partitioning protein